MKNQFIKEDEHIQLLAEIELKGRIIDEIAEYNVDSESYDYDVRDIIEAVVEDLAQSVDHNSPSYGVIVNIIEDRVKAVVDNDKLADIAADMAREVREDAEERRLLMEDYLRAAGAIS